MTTVRLILLRATKGAHNSSLSCYNYACVARCNQPSFGLPPMINGIHRAQSDHAPLFTFYHVTLTLSYPKHRTEQATFDRINLGCTPQPLAIVHALLTTVNNRNIPWTI